jgi:hypothetical protein
MNSLFLISPYKHEDFWVFDDPEVGLQKEPFVSGADVIIDLLTAAIPDAEHGFRLLFSPTAFPGYQARFVWYREEFGGNWYTWPERGVEGWLCPALFKYFPQAPAEIYVQAQARRV